MVLLWRILYFRRIALCLSYLFYSVDASLISKSSVTLCENDDSEPSSTEGTACSKKILVTMGLQGGQGNTDSIYANIDRAYKEYEGDQELSRLKAPYRIEISKSEVIVGYEVYYVGSANARPTEEVVVEKFCSDDWHLPANELACGKYHDGSEYVFNSQGFCCRCSASQVLSLLENRKSHRGGHTCHLFGGTFSSSHCLRLDDLWYDVFDISVPYIWYNITVDILQFEGVEEDETGEISVNWIPVSSLTISPEKPLGRSENGRVLAEIQGDLVGGTFLKDFSSKNLLVPNIVQLPEGAKKPLQHTNGPSDWLILDKHLVDLRGTTCNRVGTSFTAFRTQHNQCFQDRGSCLNDQPLDYWEFDNQLRREDRTGFYMMYNFGEIHPTSKASNHTIIMRFKHTDFRNTLVTLQIDATDITYVYSVASGRIVNAYATDFEALRHAGFIYVEIENTGEVTSQFTLTVSRCSRGVQRAQGREVSLDPGQAVEVTFQVETYRGKGADYSCEVELFDSEYNLLQTADVSFTTNGTCFCYGVCGCVCDPEEEIVCPDPPNVHIFTDTALRVFLLILQTLGPHGIIAIVGGLFILLGAFKLCFGKVLCHRKSKSEKLAAELKKQGVLADNNGPLPVVCGGECSGARAAKARYERRAQRMERRGKKSALDKNWRNSSYACTCHTELEDVRCVLVIQSLLFFFYCWFIPCVLIGKRVVGKFENTEKKKTKAKRKWVRKAVAGGKGYKYLMGKDLEGVQEDSPMGADPWLAHNQDSPEEKPLEEEQPLLHSPTEQPLDEALVEDSQNNNEESDHDSGEDKTEETDKYLDVVDVNERKNKDTQGRLHVRRKSRRNTDYRVKQATDFNELKRHMHRNTEKHKAHKTHKKSPSRSGHLEKSKSDKHRGRKRDHRRKSHSRRGSKSTQPSEIDSEREPE